ncbi:LUD domain-containing protein [Lutibacter citreus]|uniref:LUD domain-containing protein n=1 Tax=Lutibacter citreus TaxID=2138210 RepID=UPI000DBE113B|nr:LUD domain-containing protein [Lutibacter citreus]
MGIFKNIFRSSKPKVSDTPSSTESKNLPLDQIFVENFIKNQGKFLYCTSLEDVILNLDNIIKENNWETIICNDIDLLKLIKTLNLKIKNKISNYHPIFLSCEHLIAENGSILFSSNQLKENKISELSENFIVYATTSQLVKTKGESLTGIKTRYKGNIPSNISAIKNYNPNSSDDHFMSYGNTNSKNLYLLLFEDL